MNYSAGSSDGLGAPGSPHARLSYPTVVVSSSPRYDSVTSALPHSRAATRSSCSCPFSPARRGRFARPGARSLSRTPDVVEFRQDVLMPDRQSLGELRGTEC